MYNNLCGIYVSTLNLAEIFGCGIRHLLWNLDELHVVVLEVAVELRL